MKINLFPKAFVLSLALVAAFGVALLNSSASFATSGNFRWIDQQTIRADNVATGKNSDYMGQSTNLTGSVDFKGQNPDYSATYTYTETEYDQNGAPYSTSECKIQAAIKLYVVQGQAHITVTTAGHTGFMNANCADQYAGSGDITIADTQNGPGQGANDAATSKAILDAMQPGLNKLHTSYMAYECQAQQQPSQQLLADCQNTYQQKWDGFTTACADEASTKATSAEKEQSMIDCMTKAMPTQALKDEVANDLKGIGAAIDSNLTSATDEKKTSCKPEGIGWILCPISNAIAGMVDGLFGVVASFMKIPPILGNNTQQKPLMDAWGIMRNLANVAFVIAFMYIIFSQISGIGINNYGIKKLLPRLIVGAVLVNVSFFICALAIDLSNISGTALYEMLISLRGEATSTTMQQGGQLAGAITASILAFSGVLAGSAIAVAVAGGPWAAVAGLLVFLLPAILALLVVFLVLILRQALIIVFIIISPLAFVAYLLPNTESWYKKWVDAFSALLIMYPMLALVFGGSQLASAFIMAASQGNNTAVGFFLYLGGIFIQVIPLVIAPVLLKLSSGILARFAGMVNNPGKGVFDRARKGIKESGERSTSKAQARFLRNGGGGLAGSYARFRAKRSAVHGRVEQNLKSATTDFIADEAAQNHGENAFAHQLSGGDSKMHNAVVASALAQKEKAEKEATADTEVLVKVKFGNDLEKAFEDAVERNDGTQAKAVQNLLYAQGSSGVDKYRDLIRKNQDAMNKEGSTVASSLVQNTLEVHGQTTKAKALDVLAWAKAGGRDMKGATESADTYSGRSAEELATQTGTTLGNAFRAGGLDYKTAEDMKRNINTYNRLDDAQKAAVEAALGVQEKGYESAHTNALKEQQKRVEEQVAQAWDEAHDVQIDRARQQMEDANQRRDQERRDRFGL